MSIPERSPGVNRARRYGLSFGVLQLGLGSAAAKPDSSLQAVLRQQREAWMRDGELALAALEAANAQSSFERAAALEHRADAEISLVRAYLQAGEYRRALAFVAHTSAAHKDDSGGVALYAWMLNAAGQTEQAKRVLSEARQRFPQDRLLDQVQDRLSAAMPTPTPLLMRPPLRLAPYSAALPKGARVIGQGVLIDGGSRALVDITGSRQSARLWVRNALGQISRVRTDVRLGASGFALATLEHSLARSSRLSIASRPRYPGSVGHLVNFAAGADSKPQWPLMHSGFLGPIRGDHTRTLGIELGFRSLGGPLFDATGALAGLSVAERDGRQSLFSCAQLLGPVPPGESTTASPALIPGLATDEIYERALSLAVQTLTV